MSKLVINDLDADVDMNAVTGGGEVYSRYRGSRIFSGSWQYRYTTFRRKGTAFSSRYGWLRVYDKKKVYTRTQTMHRHYDSYWT